MNEPTALGSIFGIAFYPYGICVALAGGIGCLIFIRLWKKDQNSAEDGFLFLCYAVIGCLLLSRAGYCAVQAGFLSVDYSPRFIWRMQLGGYSLVGSIAGLLAAAWLLGRTKRHRQPFTTLLDRAAPAALFVLAGERLAECLTLDGIGGYVDNQSLQWFPLAVQDCYGDYVIPVFFWEALTALVIAIGLLLWMRKGRRGDIALTAALFLGLTQILLESLREDNYLRFGFVRVNQLLGIGMALWAESLWLIRLKPHAWPAAGVCTVLIGSTAFLAWSEYALDKTAYSNLALYFGMGVALTLLAVMGIMLRNRYPVVEEEKSFAKG